MIRELAKTGEPTFERMLPWAADLERSGAEVAVAGRILDGAALRALTTAYARL